MHPPAQPPSILSDSSETFEINAKAATNSQIMGDVPQGAFEAMTLRSALGLGEVDQSAQTISPATASVHTNHYQQQVRSPQDQRQTGNTIQNQVEYQQAIIDTAATAAARAVAQVQATPASSQASPHSQAFTRLPRDSSCLHLMATLWHGHSSGQCLTASYTVSQH